MNLLDVVNLLCSGYNIEDNSICVFLGIRIVNIFKYIVIFCIVLGNYNVSIGMQTPNKTKKSKSAKIDPAQLPYLQEHNKKSIGIIDGILLKKRSLEKEDVEEVCYKFARMNENTPLKSKKETATKYMQNFQAEACFNQSIDSIEQNNQIFNAYSSPTKSKLVSAFADLLSSPEVRSHSAVDINHVMDITQVYSADGKKLINIQGGHSFQEYLNKNLIMENDLLLIASDNKTVGFHFADEINKTLYVGLTESTVVDNLKLGKTISKSLSESRFKVSLIGSDRYVGSYQDSNNQCLYRTIFPLFVVFQRNKNETGDIYVGKFARLNSTMIHDNGSLDLCEEQELFISSSDFDNIMQQDKKYTSVFQDVIFSDITDQLNVHFQKELVALGLKKLPVSLYGVIDNLEIKP